MSRPERVLATSALLLVLVVATALQPGWLLHAIRLPAWIGGFWRTWLPLGWTAAVLALVLTNWFGPGAAWRLVSRLGGQALRLLPALGAAVLAYVTILMVAGAVTAAGLVRSGVIFGLQLGLFPATPWMLFLLGVVGGVLVLDRRAVAVHTVLRPTWPAFEALLGRATPAAWPLATALLGGVFAAALFPEAMRGWSRADAPNAQAYNLYRSFFNYSIYEDDRLESRTGFELGLRGLTLRPGSEGEVVIRLDRPIGSVVLLRTDFYNRRLAETGTSLTDETFANRLELSVAGGEYQTLLADTSVGEIIGGRVLDLTGLVGDARTYRLRFGARNTTSSEVTVLPAFSISTVVDPQAVPHFTFPMVAYAALVSGALCALAMRRYSAGTALMVGAAGGGALSVVAWAAGQLAPAGGVVSSDLSFDFDPSAPLDATYALRAARALTAAISVGAVTWAAFGLDRAARRGVTRSLTWLGLACALVTVVAIDSRWQELVRLRFELLLPDAAGYQAIGAEFPIKMERYRSERPSELLEALYDSGFDGRASAAAVFYAGGNNGREPGWPAMLRLVYNALGVSTFHTRLTSLLVASVSAGLTCWLGWRTLQPLVGLTAGLLYALNAPQIVNSVGGLREEAVGLCFLALIGALFVGSTVRVPSLIRLGVVGAAAGYLILIRADMLVLAGMAITHAALALRWKARRWLAACAVCGALAGPMYIGYAFTHRDPFYPGTYGATVNRNLEFPERMGTPGFPTAEEYAANWAAGPRISPMTYFFGYHSIPQFVSYSITGFFRVFPTILFRDQPVQLWLFVAGMALLLLRRQWLVPAVVVISLMPFYAFMAGVPNPWVFAPRYAHHTLPFAVLAAAYALWLVPLLIARRAMADASRARPGVSPLRTA